MEQVIDNPISGEHIVIRQSSADTNGRLLSFDLFLPPGGHVPATHVHPLQEERFTVLSGQLRFAIGSQTRLAGPGETIVIPPGTIHWFGNAASTTTTMHVEVRPALRMQELLERTGRLHAFSIWRLPNLAVLLLDFDREIAAPRVPAALVRGCLRLLAWPARRRQQHPA